jgi:hypothetical protein
VDETAFPPGGRPLSDPLWEPWSPAEVTTRLTAVSVPWCIAGGWALELFRGTTTRVREDLEIAVPAAGFPVIRAALSDLEFDVAGAGHLWPLDSPAFEMLHQTWGRDSVTGICRLDVFREPHDGDTWICRRDESIRRRYDTVVLHSADGIPYLAPEIVLLFKAKHSRPKDHDDFAGAQPLLSAPQRTWLGYGLRRIHPDHPWLASL